jgi:hypothetical protein
MNSRKSVHFTTLGCLSASSVVLIESIRARDEVWAGRGGPNSGQMIGRRTVLASRLHSTLEDGAAPNNAQTTLKDHEYVADAPQVFDVSPVRPVAELLPLAASPPVEPALRFEAIGANK